MTIPRGSHSNPKTAEFARLFEIFDRVATRRARAISGDTTTTHDVITADDIAHVPAEFAPVLRSLSTVLTMRVERDQNRGYGAPVNNAAASKPRRNTVSGVTNTNHLNNPPEDMEAIESPMFPLAERYPFTFKLMLHKLYDLEEWADKVKNALEASKSQFKPLAEKVQCVVKDAVGRERQVHKKGVTRSRSHSTLATAGKSSSRRMPSLSREQSTSVVKSQGSRALKKRCIGRRKSVSGPMAAGVWIYDAAISAVEVSGPRPSVEITLSESGDSRASGQVARTRHQSLLGLDGTRARQAERRRVKIAVPIPPEEDHPAVSEVEDGKVAMNGTKFESVRVKDIPKKRRAMDSLDNVRFGEKGDCSRW
ncbi:hypothetical protein ID866_5519 [Astraeus odoratus]|nr:hypothetical protein ID866_5519 [Astraeus odoratus]